MTINITREERAEILVALRSAQDVVKSVYKRARDRAGPHDPDDPVLVQLYGLRDSLIGTERSVQALDVS